MSSLPTRSNRSGSAVISAPIPDLIEYLKKELPQASTSSPVMTSLTAKRNENQISSALCEFLQMQQTPPKYYFVREEAQQGSHTIDIGIRIGGNLVFVIEAKILPTPGAPPRDVHEYVYKNGKKLGGIERFKEEKHGVDLMNKLFPICGMFGYVESETFAHWETQVNQWIDDAGWGTAEHLDYPEFINPMYYLFSEHERTGGTKVKLHHFWLKI